MLVRGNWFYIEFNKVFLKWFFQWLFESEFFPPIISKMSVWPGDNEYLISEGH